MAAVLTQSAHLPKAQPKPDNSVPTKPDTAVVAAPDINPVTTGSTGSHSVSHTLTPIDTAQARLAVSRARLRLALMPPDPDSAQANAGGVGRKPHRLGAMWRSWRRSMHGWPLVDLALDTAHTWWQRQPLRPVGELLAVELRATALPLVRKHPLITVAAAGALGVLLVAGRPWRWPLVTRQMHRAPHRVGSWLTRQLGNASVQASLIGMLMVWARRPPADTADGTAADTRPSTQPNTQPAADPNTEPTARPPAQA